MNTIAKNTTSNTETITISRAEYEAQLAENAKFKSEIADLKTYISELENKLNWFMEQFRLAQNRRFGTSSEASSQEVLDQMSFLFNEAEAEVPVVEEEQSEKKTEVRGYTRKKRSGSVRDVVPANIEVEEETHELPEEERVCPECGETMQPIGTEVRETLKLIPAKAVLHRDIYVTYGCANCRDTGIEVGAGPDSRQFCQPGGCGAYYCAEVPNVRPAVSAGTGLEPPGHHAVPAGHG